MKYLFLSVIVFLSCIKKDIKSNTISKLTKQDTLFVENEIKIYKNCVFSIFYKKALKEYKLQKKIKTEDEIKDLTLFYYSGEFNIKFLTEDKNRDKLYAKWLNDLKYEPVEEIAEGSFDMVRSLDFYNSNDLKNYLDSLKQTEYDRIINERKK